MDYGIAMSCSSVLYKEYRFGLVLRAQYREVAPLTEPVSV